MARLHWGVPVQPTMRSADARGPNGGHWGAVEEDAVGLEEQIDPHRLDDDPVLIPKLESKAEAPAVRQPWPCFCGTKARAREPSTLTE